MKTVLIVPLLLLAGGCLIAQTPYEHYHQALVYEYQEQYNEAIQAYSAAIEKKSDFTEAYFNRGNLYFAMGAWKEAAGDYSIALRYNPELFEAVNNRAQAYIELGQFDEAYPDLKTIIDHQPQNDEALLQLGIIEHRRGNNALALEYYNRTLAQNPDAALAYLGRAQLLIDINDYENAYINLERAIHLDVQSSQAYFLRGEYYLNRKMFREAADDFSIAIMLEPDLHEAYNNRAVAYESMEDYREALNDYQQAHSRAPGNAHYLINLANLHENLDNENEALKFYTMAYQLRPDDHLLRMRIARTLLATGELEAAANHFEQLRNIPAYRSEALAGIADIYMEQGKYEQCLDLLNASIVGDKAVVPLLHRRGLLRFNMYHYDYALNDLTAAIESADETPARIYYDRGRVYRALGDNVNAMRDFNRAILINRTLRPAYEERGTLRQELNDYGGAVDDFSRAIQLNEADAGLYFRRGLAMFMNEDFNAAVQDFDMALHYNPQLWQALGYRGMSFLKTGSKKEGCTDLKNASAKGFSDFNLLIDEHCR